MGLLDYHAPAFVKTFREISGNKTILHINACKQEVIVLRIQNGILYNY